MARTMFHVTDASNVDSIKQQGLKAGDLRDWVFLTDTAAAAEFLGEVYDTIDNPVVFRAEVAERKIGDDPEPSGDVDTFTHRGDIRPSRLEVVDE